MKPSDIVQLRLANQHLTTADFTTPAEVVSQLGAVQAQDFPAAKWALGLRMKSGSEEVVAKAYDEGKILRTHVMRPTWHFLVPEDIEDVLSLTASRVHAVSKYMYNRENLTPDIFARCEKILKEVLKGTYLTRTELGEILTKHNIPAIKQTLAYILIHAELERVICSGPRKGKQFTYALFNERVPQVKKKSQDEALSQLMLKYFTSHGPAQLIDFSWWSGLSMQSVTEGISLVGSRLQKEIVEGKEYWFAPQQLPPIPVRTTAFLLSIYDEYTIAYKDRSALGGDRYVEKFITMGNALTAVIIVDGQIVGTWKREMKKESIVVLLNLLKNISSTQKEALEEAAKQYGKYHALPVCIQLTS